MMEVIDCAQGSPEWRAARLGIPTASEFATVLARGRDGPSKTRQTYLYKLAGEIVTGAPMESYTNGHMDRGHALEDEARAEYEFVSANECAPVGFIRSGRKGASPDRLIGTSGMLEIKTKAAHLLVEILTKEADLPEHLAQCQGQMWVAEREWVDLVCYWPRLPLYVKRIARDEVYIRRLSAAVDAFNEELDEIVDRVRRFGRPEPKREPLSILGAG